MDLKGNIIITAEDILYDTAQSLGKYIRNNYYPTYCNKIQDVLLDYDYNKRPYKSLLLSITKPNLDETKAILLGSLLNKLYYNNETTYSNYFTISKFGQTFSNNISVLESDTIQNIYILYSGNEIVLDLLKKQYKHKKYTFIHYNTLEDCLKYLQKIRWNLLITDISDLPIEYVKQNINENIIGKEVLMPIREYCKIDQIDQILLEERGGLLNYFN
jgi:hypothetical protein